MAASGGDFFTNLYASLINTFLVISTLILVIIPALIFTPVVFFMDIIIHSCKRKRSCAPEANLHNAPEGKPLEASLIPDPKAHLVRVTFGEGDQARECHLVTSAALPGHLAGIPRRIIISAVGSFSYFFCQVYNRVKIHNIDTLIDLIHNRPEGVPLITVANHTSTLDDPFMWATWKLRCSDASVFRWTLTAHDICFTTPFTAYFFRAGKSIPVNRFGGIHQGGMMEAIDVINRGEWVHVFPEGRVIQGQDPIERLKWGIGSLIARTTAVPLVVCIGLSGFEKVKPEVFLRGRPSVTPLMGKRVNIVVGEPFQFDVPSLQKEAEEAVLNGDPEFGSDCFMEPVIFEEAVEENGIMIGGESGLGDQEKAALIKREKILAVGDEATRRLYSEITRRIQHKLIPVVMEARDLSNSNQ